MDMSVNIAGIRLANPVMTASGTFGWSTKSLWIWADSVPW